MKDRLKAEELPKIVNKANQKMVELGYFDCDFGGVCVWFDDKENLWKVKYYRNYEEEHTTVFLTCEKEGEYAIAGYSRGFDDSAIQEEIENLYTENIQTDLPDLGYEWLMGGSQEVGKLLEQVGLSRFKDFFDYYYAKHDEGEITEVWAAYSCNDAAYRLFKQVL